MPLTKAVKAWACVQGLTGGGLALGVVLQAPAGWYFGLAHCLANLGEVVVVGPRKLWNPQVSRSAKLTYAVNVVLFGGILAVLVSSVGLGFFGLGDG
jgi:hypothetical protein